MQVKEVISFLDQTEFIAFPKQLYQENKDYVSPLDKDITAVFDPKTNKNFHNGEAVRWIIVKNHITVGRIAAFYKSVESEKEGGIGFFESVNNQDVANKLFEVAATWLKERGCKFMDGPINFGERDKYWGLLVSGFKNPSYQENFNFPNYQTLFETAGFKKIFEQTTSEIDVHSIQIERVSKLAERVFKNPAYRYEHYEVKKMRKYAADFIEIYNKAWAHRPDFSPITTERIESTLVSLNPIMIEEAIWFVYANDEPAGFYVNVMDVNQIFKHLNGKMGVIEKLKFLYYKHFRKVDRMRGIVFGVIPAYQNLGLETGLIMKVLNSMREHRPEFIASELSWIGDFNPKMHRLFDAVGAKPTKIHYTYRFTF
jgi:hypothetical protein